MMIMIRFVAFLIIFKLYAVRNKDNFLFDFIFSGNYLLENTTHNATTKVAVVFKKKAT